MWALERDNSDSTENFLDEYTFPFSVILYSNLNPQT